MTKAKNDLLKLSIIFFLVWLIFLILGLIINEKEVISNILFGLGSFTLFPFIFFFFKSKKLKSKILKNDIKNYLTKKEYDNIKKNKMLLKKKINNLKYKYWLGFSTLFSILFIGTACLFVFL